MTIQEEIKQLKERLAVLEERAKNEPEFQPGDLVEAWDDDPAVHLHIGIYKEKAENEHLVLYNSHGLYSEYKQCRLFKHSHILKPIKWEGGKCPVGDQEIVLFKYRNKRNDLAKAGDVSWQHTHGEYDIVQYAILSEAWQ
jgi:hypothetical protein